MLSPTLGEREPPRNNTTYIQLGQGETNIDNRPGKYQQQTHHHQSQDCASSPSSHGDGSPSDQTSKEVTSILTSSTSPPETQRSRDNHPVSSPHTFFPPYERGSPLHPRGAPVLRSPWSSP